MRFEQDSKESPWRSGEGIPRRVRSQCKFPGQHRPGEEVVGRQEERKVGKRWGCAEGRGNRRVSCQSGVALWAQGEVMEERQAERDVIWLISEKDSSGCGVENEVQRSKDGYRDAGGLHQGGGGGGFWDYVWWRVEILIVKIFPSPTIYIPKWHCTIY